MTAARRREQLVDVGRAVFAERGYEATSIEELAVRADVSKPVLYEHFGGKEGLYTAVVDREMQRLLERFTAALTEGGGPRALLERAALVLLRYVEDDTDGFLVLSRDSPGAGGSYSSLLGEIAHRVEHILAEQLAARGSDPQPAALYSQALVGMVALVGQWWLEHRTLDRDEVAARLVDLAYSGLSHLDPHPVLRTVRPDRG
jgi:AcrR family transcriptional regulator